MNTFKAVYNNKGFTIESNGIDAAKIAFAISLLLFERKEDFDIFIDITKLGIAIMEKKEDIQKTFFKAARKSIGDINEPLYMIITESGFLDLNVNSIFLHTLLSALIVEIISENMDKSDYILEKFSQTFYGLLEIKDKSAEEKGKEWSREDFVAAYLGTVLAED